MNCWYKTNLNSVNALRNDWLIPNLSLKSSDVSNNEQYTWDYKCEDIFTPQWIEKLKEIGFDLWKVMVFYKPKNFKNNWAHIDTYSDPPDKIVECGLNWIISNGDSEMHWYSSPSDERIVRWTESNRPYIAWPINELIEIDQCSINHNPVLINTGQPHAIVNENSERWCISVRFYVDNTWDEIVDLWFKKNLLIER